MRTFKNIIVGIDFSEASKTALKQAWRIATQEGGKLTALHVLSPSEMAEFEKFYSVSTDTITRTSLKCIEEIVEEKLGSRNAAKCEVVVGVPSQELIRRTRETDCDLLVLGSRGASSLEHEVGFFAAKCIRQAGVPILLTRPRHVDIYQRVVACVDFSEATPEVIETAAKVALDANAELHLVHAVCPPWMRPTHVLYNLETAEDDDFKAQYRELLDEQMDAAVRSANQFLPLDVHPHTLEHPNPNQAILNFLKEYHADLAVVGRSGHTAAMIKHYLLGSTAERLIHRGPCSVITVPPKGRNQDR